MRPGRRGLTSLVAVAVVLLVPFDIAPGAAAAALHASTLGRTAHSLRFADGKPKGKALSPFVVRLRSLALKKTPPTAAAPLRPERRARLLVRVAQNSNLPPEQASDLVDSIPTKWSARKRTVAVALTHAFAGAGTVVRSSTYASLVKACRGAGELDEARALLERLHTTGKRANPSVYGSLISEYCRAGQPWDAQQLEAGMRAVGVRPNNMTLTVLLSSLVRLGDVPSAIELARRLHRDDSEVYDLPLHNAIVQALLAGGDAEEVAEALEALRLAGYAPSAYTLNIVLKGFLENDGSLQAALDVFNSFLDAGGTPGTRSYNILLVGFARQGQLLNCEALFTQLCAQHEASRARAAAAASVDETPGSARGDRLGDGGGDHEGNPADDDADESGGGAADDDDRPDAFTYNALLMAAINARKPRAALAYRRLMRREGVAANAATLTLLGEAHARDGRPLDGLREAKRALNHSELPKLDEACYSRLLRACVEASEMRVDARRARQAMLWLLGRMLIEHVGSADAAAALMGPAVAEAARLMLATVDEDPEEGGGGEEETAAADHSGAQVHGKASGKKAGRPQDQMPTKQGGHGVPLALLLVDDPPWHERSDWLRDMVLVCGYAYDFASARWIFESAPKPRSDDLWEAMVRVCNVCNEPAYTSDILKSQLSSDGTLPLPGSPRRRSKKGGRAARSSS